jgi:hypothetical protein
MQVSNILSSLANAASLTKPNPATTPAASNPVVAAAPAAAGLSSSSAAAVRSVLSKYDMTDISPSDFSQMIQQLYQSGGISQQNLQELNAIRTDLESAGVGPEESVNLIDFYTQKIASVQSQSDLTGTPAEQQQITPLMQRLDWLQKFNAMKAQPDSANLSALA